MDFEKKLWLLIGIAIATVGIVLAALLLTAYHSPSSQDPCQNPSMGLGSRGPKVDWQFGAAIAALQILVTIGIVVVENWSRSSWSSPDENNLVTGAFVAVFFMGSCLAFFAAFLISRSGSFLVPNFLDVCDIDDYDYSSAASFALRTAVVRSAFPSTWISLVAFMMTTVVVWARHRKETWPRKIRRVTCLAIQLTAVGFALATAWLVCLLDNGDWIDVLTGLFVGILIAIGLFQCIAVDLLGWRSFDELPHYWDERDPLLFPMYPDWLNQYSDAFSEE